MIPHEMPNCAEVLLDLVCYEISRGKLSPEMRAILADHLAKCGFCRTHFLNFKRLMEESPPRVTYLQ
jgi:hypothetical protein